MPKLTRTETQFLILFLSMLAMFAVWGLCSVEGATGTVDDPTAITEMDFTKIRLDTNRDGTGLLLDEDFLTTFAATINQISDADGDTKIQVEKGADDDTIRFDVGGAQDVLKWDSSGLTLHPGTLMELYGEALESAIFKVTRHNDIVPGAAPSILLQRSRGSRASETIVLDGDSLGFLSWKAYDGSIMRSAGYITMTINGTPGASDVPGKMWFYTVPDGSITALPAFHLDQDQSATFYGDVGIDNLLFHTGDADTNIAFTDDEIAFSVGGREFFVLSEGGTDKFIINDGNSDMEFMFGSTKDDFLLFADSTTARIGIDNENPEAPLHVIFDAGTFSGSTVGIFEYQHSNVTTSIKIALLLKLETDGNMADTFGPALDFAIEDPGAEVTIARIAGTRGSLGDGYGQLDFYTSGTDGLVSVMNIDYRGDVEIARQLSVYGAAVYSKFYNDTSSGFPAFTGWKARGTRDAPTIVQADNHLLSWDSHGYDGEKFLPGGGISMFVDATPGLNDMPTRMEFSTTADGALVKSVRMTIKQDGKIGINTEDPDYLLDVKGDIGIDAKICHNDNSDTYMLFAPDQWYLYNGGYRMITTSESVTDGYIVLNEDSRDFDFRVESDNDENAFFVRGSDGFIGIGRAEPGVKVEIGGSVRMVAESGISCIMRVYSDTPAVAASFGAMHARNTEAAPSSTMDNDTLASYFGQGYDTGISSGGSMIFLADDDWNGSATDNPTRWELALASNASETRSNRLVVDSNGGVFMPDTFDDDVVGKSPVDAYIGNDGQIGMTSSARRNPDGSLNKENVRDVPTTHVARIMALRPRIADYVHGPKKKFCLIAEEVAEVMPEIVAYNRIEHVTSETIQIDHWVYEIVTHADGTTESMQVNHPTFDIASTRTFTMGIHPTGVNYSQLAVRNLWMIQRQQIRINQQEARIGKIESQMQQLLAALIALGLITVAGGGLVIRKKKQV